MISTLFKKSFYKAYWSFIQENINSSNNFKRRIMKILMQWINDFYMHVNYTEIILKSLSNVASNDQ